MTLTQHERKDVLHRADTQGEVIAQTQQVDITDENGNTRSELHQIWCNWCNPKHITRITTIPA